MLLSDLPAGAAARTPDATALLDGDRSWTFAALDREVRGLAAALAGCEPAGAPVAVLAHSRAEYVVAYYGVPLAGRVLVPLNPRLHPSEWAAQLRRAGAGLVVGEAELLDALPAGAPTRVAFGTDAWAGLVATTPGPAPAVDPEDTAWLLFTSGTTGTPKGVRLTHRGLLAAVRSTAAMRPVAPDDVFCTPFPLCHVAGYSVLVHHAHARPVLLLRRFDPAALVAAVRDAGVTSASLAPTMLDALLAHVDAHPADGELLRARLRTVGYGASPMPERLLRRTAEVLGCALNQGYGMTELSGNAVFLDAAAHRRALADRPQWLRAAGRPAPGVELRIVGPDGAALPTGGVGEIAVRAEQVSPGYWDGAEPPPTDGWLCTGDVGRLDADGVLYVVDRVKDLVVTGGENVSSVDVEEVLRTVPGVLDVAVIGLPDERWGERVCAVIVAAPGAAPTEETLVAACRARLAGFKVPRRVCYLDELPRTGTGKVRKDELRRRLAGPLTPVADPAPAPR